MAEGVPVTVLDHALVRHHLCGLREVRSAPAAFRQHVRVLATILAAEATRDLPLRPVSVETPLETTTGSQLAVRVAAVPILRAGLGMTEPFLEMIPELEVWHLGLYRDEATAEPVHYYDKLPAHNPPEFAVVLDPMLATGGSASMAIAALTRWGVPEIRMLSLIAAPEGIRKLNTEWPAVRIVTCAIDRELDDRRYIRPGLGDAGDRLFGTG